MYVFEQKSINFKKKSYSICKKSKKKVHPSFRSAALLYFCPKKVLGSNCPNRPKMIVINSGDTTITQNSAAQIFWSQLLKKIGLLRWLGLDKSLWFSLKQMDGREKKDTYFKHQFLSHGKHLRKHGFQTMWDSFLERWVFIRSLSVGYFLREKIREIRPQKTSGLGGWHPCRHFT